MPRLRALVLVHAATATRALHRLSGEAVSQQGSIFDGWPEAERTIVIEPSNDQRIRTFIVRNAYNTTHQQRMEKELRELLDAIGVEVR
jgi:uncharacterized protein (DUF1330 family)